MNEVECRIMLEKCVRPASAVGWRPRIISGLRCRGSGAPFPVLRGKVALRADWPPLCPSGRWLALMSPLCQYRLSGAREWMRKWRAKHRQAYGSLEYDLCLTSAGEGFLTDGGHSGVAAAGYHQWRIRLVTFRRLTMEIPKGRHLRNRPAPHRAVSYGRFHVQSSRESTPTLCHRSDV